MFIHLNLAFFLAVT